jgi:hypothetical protein
MDGMGGWAVKVTGHHPGPFWLECQPSNLSGRATSCSRAGRWRLFFRSPATAASALLADILWLPSAQSTPWQARSARAQLRCKCKSQQLPPEQTCDFLHVQEANCTAEQQADRQIHANNDSGGHRERYMYGSGGGKNWKTGKIRGSQCAAARRRWILVCDASSGARSPAAARGGRRGGEASGEADVHARRVAQSWQD